MSTDSSPTWLRSLHDTCAAASSAFVEVRSKPVEFRADMIEAIAAALDSARANIISTCAEETALTPGELAPEFDRMTGTLRMFAALIREGSWVRAAISRKSQQTIGPNHDVRSMLVPLGPVAIFGSSNFPLAYGVCGGDTASALAAGCPVVVKEHPAHSRTGRLLYSIASAAATSAHAPNGFLGYIENTDPADFGPAGGLVKHPDIRAVGFTGSTRGGFAIINLTHERQRAGIPDIIPVFAEMGSCNVIIVLRDAIRGRPHEIVEQIAQSLLARHGQQCTAPGVVLVAGHENSQWFYDALARRIAGSSVRRMLAPSVAASFYQGVEAAIATGAIEQHTRLPTTQERDAGSTPPLLLYTQAVKMERGPELWQEIFGPALIVVGCDALACGYFGVPDALTVTIIGDDDATFETDSNAALDDAYIGSRAELLDQLQARAGRIIFNGVPTGVRVAEGMVHGGPFPATNRPDTTAVGPRAIERWCRPVCWQNAPQELLPDELKDTNPLGIRRVVDGKLE